MAKVIAIDYDMFVDVEHYLVIRYIAHPEGEEEFSPEPIDVQIIPDYSWTVSQLNDAKVDVIQTDVYNRYGVTVSNTDITYNKHDRPLL